MRLSTSITPVAVKVPDGRGRRAGLRRSTSDGPLPAGQPTRAGSRTIRRLLVRASSRSMAAATSLGGDSLDQRLPTRRSSPRRSSSCSRASALSLLIPAARAAIAVENEAGSLRSAARTRSGRWSVPRSPERCCDGARDSAVAGTGFNGGAGLCPIGGSSPKRARQLLHKTTGSRPVGRTSSNRRHPRPERQTPQRRPAFSISVRSSVRNGVLVFTIERRSRRRSKGWITGRPKRSYNTRATRQSTALPEAAWPDSRSGVRASIPWSTLAKRGAGSVMTSAALRRQRAFEAGRDPRSGPLTSVRFRPRGLVLRPAGSVQVAGAASGVRLRLSTWRIPCQELMAVGSRRALRHRRR